jgi:arylsulfatase A-like enzyme
VIPAGRVEDGFLTALEVFPTLAKAAGAAAPAGVTLDGFDMLPVLRGEAKSPRGEMFWQRRTDKAARVGRYKWVESARGAGLFDLEKDVGEKNDLGRERPELLAQVKGRWQAWRKAMDDAEPRGPFRDY